MKKALIPIMLLCITIFINTASSYPQNNSDVVLDFHAVWLSNNTDTTESSNIMIGGQDQVGLKYGQAQVYIGYLEYSFKSTSVPEAQPSQPKLVLIKFEDDNGKMAMYGLLGALIIGVLVYFLTRIN